MSSWCLVLGYTDHYNNVRLNSAVGYITPTDMLAGRQQEIHAPEAGGGPIQALQSNGWANGVLSRR